MGDRKMAPSRPVHSIYRGENPGRAGTVQGNQLRGSRDGSPGMVIGFSHPPTDKQWVPSSEPDEYPTQTTVSVLVTMK